MQVNSQFCKPIWKPYAAEWAETGETQRAGDDLKPPLRRTQGGRQRLPETAETSIASIGRVGDARMRFAARFGPGGGYSPAAASGGANSTTFQVTELMPLRYGDLGACRRRRQWAVIGICPLPVTEMPLCLYGM